MQIILFMLGLFTIGCVLYGISAGVQVIVRALTHWTGSPSNSASNSKASTAPRALATATAGAAPTREALQSTTDAEKPANASPLQRSIDELRDIFALYKQGALTQAEFEDMKQCLLAGIKTPAPQGH